MSAPTTDHSVSQRSNGTQALHADGVQTTRADHAKHEPHIWPVGAGTASGTDQGRSEAHVSPVGAGSDHPTDHQRHDNQPQNVGGVTNPGNNQTIHDTQCAAVVAGQSSPASQRCDDTQNNPAGGGSGPGSVPPATKVETTPIESSSLSDPLLALAADVLDDAERSRIANENRLRQLTRDEADSDGETRGFGLDETDPDVARLAAIVQMYADLEKQAAKNLEKRLKAHPLGPWCKAQKGIGDKQAARLLAVIGDPYINEQTGEIRTVAQLWAYCGHGDPGRRKRKGMSQAELFALGNPVAKSRLWLIATACLKAQGDYADVYYDRKDDTESRLHATECVRCGPSGKPAQVGTPWSNAHRHADALRIVGKEILRDLYIEAKRIHEEV